jgi:CheY-like chemotaxis protein
MRLSDTVELSVGPYALVVDDDEGIREAMIDLLSMEGYDVLCAENGCVALALMQQAALPPFVILLDLNMPVMDGYQVLAELRQDATRATIPVIVMTANRVTHEDLVGAVGLVPKPVAVDDLLLAVEDAIRKATDSQRVKIQIHRSQSRVR